MIVFPNAKINLGLRVLNKRSDGFHNIESYMVPVSLCDALEVVPADAFAYSGSGFTVDGSEEKNLCVVAYQKMREAYRVAPVKIHLHKVIPMGAGLGGGSSDAAFTLTLIRRLFNLRLCNNELELMASFIGSDCPFFIVNKPRMIHEKGRPVAAFLQIPRYDVVIVVPRIIINTAWAYSILKPSGKSLPLPESILNHEEEWRMTLFNDFEKEIFNWYPQLGDIKQALYNAGAFYASLSGSGSAIYGLFKTEPDVEGLFSDCFVWKGCTLL